MRRQPGRSPEEGTSLSTADALRRTVSGRRRGRRRRGGSLFAAAAGSPAVPPSSSPPSSPSSDGPRAFGTGGTANAPAGVLLSGLVSMGSGHLRLNDPRRTSIGQDSSARTAHGITPRSEETAFDWIPVVKAHAALNDSGRIEADRYGRDKLYIYRVKHDALDEAIDNGERLSYSRQCDRRCAIPGERLLLVLCLDTSLTILCHRGAQFGQVVRAARIFRTSFAIELVHEE